MAGPSIRVDRTVLAGRGLVPRLAMASLAPAATGLPCPGATAEVEPGIASRSTKVSAIPWSNRFASALLV
jgi:hypothetical protein